MRTGDLSTDDKSTDDKSTDDMSTDDMSTDDMSTDDMSTGRNRIRDLSTHLASSNSRSMVLSAVTLILTSISISISISISNSTSTALAQTLVPLADQFQVQRVPMGERIVSDDTPIPYSFHPILEKGDIDGDGREDVVTLLMLMAMATWT